MKWSRLPLVLLATAAAMTLLAGCAPAREQEAEQVKSQEAQLDGYIHQADTWGDAIIAQIPAEEPETVYPNDGGVREASDMYEEWPKYYYWARSIDLRFDGPRSTVRLADDLEPWLEKVGWRRNRASEFPPSPESFKRDYFRGRYHLTVEVYTQAPPRAQTIDFIIVTPDTNSEK